MPNTLPDHVCLCFRILRQVTAYYRHTSLMPCCSIFLYLLIFCFLGSQAIERSDELFLPNPFGDKFRDVNLAWEMASLSQVVYDVEPDTLNIGALPEQYHPIRFKDTGSTEVMVVTTNATSISTGASIIVVFRGTDESPDGDWQTNFQTSLGPFGPPDGPIVKETIYDDLGLGNGIEAFDILVHSGFNDALFSENLFSELKELLLGYLDNLSYNNTVHITGHSLGGANAQLFGTLLAYENPNVDVIITTFASPMVGNYGFKVLADSLKNLNNWRFVNRQDVVPRGPVPDYYPAGHIIWKQPGENGAVVAYYRQTGDAKQGYDAIGSNFYTTLGTQLVEDHYMLSYKEWLDSAKLNMQANYTCGFEGSDRTECAGAANGRPSSSRCFSFLFSFAAVLLSCVFY